MKSIYFVPPRDMFIKSLINDELNYLKRRYSEYKIVIPYLEVSVDVDLEKYFEDIEDFDIEDFVIIMESNKSLSKDVYYAAEFALEEGLLLFCIRKYYNNFSLIEIDFVKVYDCGVNDYAIAFPHADEANLIYLPN